MDLLVGIFQMKFKLQLVLILFALAASACSGNVPPVNQPFGEPPTPFPDTPSPSRIDAPLVENPSILLLDMFNELDGWAVTETEIVRTNDGGISWYNVTPTAMQETGY